MEHKRIRDTRQHNLTSEQLEEREKANNAFYEGDLIQKYFQSQEDLHCFLFRLCRKHGFTPCAQ